MDDDLPLSARIDKFLAGTALDASEKAATRDQIDAADAALVAAHAAAIADIEVDVATNAAAIADTDTDVATNAAGVATNAAAIAALDVTVATHTTDLEEVGVTLAEHSTAIDGLETAVAANTETIGNINDTLSSAVTGVASVAGLTGVISGPDLRGALNVALNADVTNATNVGAAIASVPVKNVLVDDDAVGGLDSEAAGVLKRFSIASVVARAKAVFDGLYASIAQGAKADSALQPSTAAELTRLQLTPVAFESLPEAATAGAGAVANINDGSVGVIGSDAAGGGAITQRVISNGDAWIVDSGVSGGLQAVEGDASPRLGGVLDANGKQVRFAKGANVVSTAALPIGNDGNFFTVTGTTDITSIAAKGIGTRILLHFADTLTLTHHASNLILPHAAHVVTAAGDVAEFVQHTATGWRCAGYLRANNELDDYVRFADLTDGDKVDGDRFDIDYPAKNYTPRVIGVPEALNTDSLAAHLAGIDAALGEGAVPDANGNLLAVSWEPSHYARTTGEGHANTTHLASHLAGIDLALENRLRPEDAGDGARLDGDVIDVDFAPSNYEPTTAGAPEAANAQSLAAHLKGIDNVLAGGVSGGSGRQWLTYEVLGPLSSWESLTPGAPFSFVTRMPATSQVHSIVLVATENTGHQPTFAVKRNGASVFAATTAVGATFAKGTRASGLATAGAPAWSAAGYVITEGSLLTVEASLTDSYAEWGDFELRGLQVMIEISPV